MATRKKEKVAIKPEEKALQDYELVLIVKPEATEESLDATVNNVSQFITGKEGVIAEVQKWGKKKLAYPVAHGLEGNYILAKFKMKARRCKELEANLKITEDILRHLLIKVS